MAGFVGNIIQNSLSGFVSGAVTTVGGYAGDAVGGIGNLIEGAGTAVGTGIGAKFNGVGQGITSYGNSIKNATAPNAGGGYSTGDKKTAVKKTESKPKPGAAQKALPSSKPMKAIGAPPTKKDVQTPYIPPAPVKKVDPKKAPIGANGQKKVTPEARSMPTSKPFKSYQPSAGKEYKPAIPGYGDKPASKAGSVAGSVKPYTNGTAKKAPSAVGSVSKGGYKPPSSVGGYKPSGSVAGSVAGSNAGGPKFF